MNELIDCFLYGIVDLSYVKAGSVSEVTTRLVRGGIDILQIRGKRNGLDEIKRAAVTMFAITRPANVPLIINDFPALLTEIDAEGVHLGQSDGSIAAARAQANRPIIVGRSTHSLEQAIQARDEGADYVGYGPIFATQTKQDAKPVGLADIDRIQDQIKIPVFCIGGITEANLHVVSEAGAQRVAVVSDLLLAPDINARTRALKAML